jgi:hypothetical protein
VAPPPPNLSQEEVILARLRVAKSVFAGTATKTQKQMSVFNRLLGPFGKLFRSEEDFVHTATFRVDTNVKNAPNQEIRVTTGRFGSGRCGFKATIGESLLVYAYGEKELETSICSVSQLDDSREELKVLLSSAAQQATGADR